MDTEVQFISTRGRGFYVSASGFHFYLTEVSGSKKKKRNAKNLQWPHCCCCCCKLISINPSFLHPNKTASAGCHCLKITISPPLSCLINNSDVQFRNFAINLLKYCWRMLIVMPVAIKAHLHNVCAKNNYELLIAQEPAENARSNGGGEGDVCKMGACARRWRDSTESSHKKPDLRSRVCRYQATPAQRHLSPRSTKAFSPSK